MMKTDMPTSLTRRRAVLSALALAAASPFALASDGISHLGSVDSNGVRHVSATEAAEVLASDPAITVLDVRTAAEFESGHLAGAVNVDYYASDFREQLAKLDKDATWVVHCRTGVRSGRTLPILNDLEFTSIVHLEKGIRSWLNAGLPVKK